MDKYQKPSGRFMEIIVGLFTTLISLIFLGLVIFFGLLGLVEVATGIEYSGIFKGIISLFVGIICFFVAHWFGKISERLLLNKPRGNGGLFSIGGLKFWCIAFCLMSLMLIKVGLSSGDNHVFIVGIFGAVAFFKGWRIAIDREHTAQSIATSQD